MEITLGEATKLLDNIMAHYSQWHTERSTSKKVHAIEEIDVLSGKMHELMKLFATKSAPIDPNDMPLSTFIENNNDLLSSPIAPLNDVESCEINVSLLNLVMKDQFSGLPSEDAASHLNNFVDLCEMQKKKRYG